MEGFQVKSALLKRIHSRFSDTVFQIRFYIHLGKVLQTQPNDFSSKSKGALPPEVRRRSVIEDQFMLYVFDPKKQSL
jgi:hypothetical protein